MQVSYSTLALLDQHGDRAAHTILCAWRNECGVLWESCSHNVHYRALWDYFVITQPDEGRQVFAPCMWGRVRRPALDLDLSDLTRFQKGR